MSTSSQYVIQITSIDDDDDDNKPDLKLTYIPCFLTLLIMIY